MSASSWGVWATYRHCGRGAARRCAREGERLAGLHACWIHARRSSYLGARFIVGLAVDAGLGFAGNAPTGCGAGSGGMLRRDAAGAAVWGSGASGQGRKHWYRRDALASRGVPAGHDAVLVDGTLQGQRVCFGVALRSCHACKGSPPPPPSGGRWHPSRAKRSPSGPGQRHLRHSQGPHGHRFSAGAGVQRGFRAQGFAWS